MRPAKAAGGGGIRGWLPLTLGLGLLAGVLGVGAIVLLGGGVAGPTPTLSPTLTPTLTPTLVPTEPPSEPPTDAPAVQLEATRADASSVVGNRDKFAPEMAIDGDPTTSWQEGAAQEAGQWIEVTVPAARLDHLVIWAGYQLSEDAYFANRRPRDVVITIDGGSPIETRLADTLAEQRVELGGLVGSVIRIELRTTYDPEKTDYPGSPFDDTAISEIQVFGSTG